MNKDIKELREMGYSDEEIANILADGDDKIADEISDEIKKADAVETEAEATEDQTEADKADADKADADKADADKADEDEK